MTSPFVSLNFEHKEIYPYIRVYKKICKNEYTLPDGSTSSLYEIIKNAENRNTGEYIYGKWDKWHVFGKYASAVNGSFDGKIVKLDTNFEEEFQIYQALHEISTLGLTHYCASYEIPLPENSFITRPSLASYHENFKQDMDDNDDLAMVYHADNVLGEWYWPGEKFFITSTFYPNDDYDGGEISFLVGGNTITYKPEAGDLVVFPSGDPLWPSNEPYFHAAKAIQNGKKYLIRTYIKYSVEHGTDEWYKGVLEYGEEEWKKEAKRRANDTNSVSFNKENGRAMMSEVAAKLFKRDSRYLN